MKKALNKHAKKGLVVVIDMHKIPQYDRNHDDELVCSRHSRGTCLYEAYITAQCVIKGVTLNFAVLPMHALETAAESVPKIAEKCPELGVP